VKGSEIIVHDLYEKMSFILHGGILDRFADYLSNYTNRALLLESRKDELILLEAVGITPSSLILSDKNEHIASLFSNQMSLSPFPINVDLFSCTWKWGLSIKGEKWSFYLLVDQQPSSSFLETLPAFEGIIDIWQSFKEKEKIEHRLSRLDYMILATKSTLASIFEPMPLEYFAAFLGDVIRESLFPEDLLILHDDGDMLHLLEGKLHAIPERDAVLTKRFLTSAPLPIDEKHKNFFGENHYAQLSKKWTVFLPVLSKKQRLYCLLKWNRALEQEDLNFLELLGNIASKALSISCLHEERDSAVKQLTSQTFALQALHNATLHLMRQTERRSLLDSILDMFSEVTQSHKSLIVAWDSERQSYVFHGTYQDGKVIHSGKCLYSCPLSITDPNISIFSSFEMASSFFDFLNAPELLAFEEIQGADIIVTLTEGNIFRGFVALWSTSNVDFNLLENLAETTTAAMCCFYTKRGFLN